MRMQMNKTEKHCSLVEALQRNITSMVIALVALSFGACAGPNQTPSRTAAARQPTPATPSDEDVEYVRRGRFVHVYVIKRQDGGAFTPDNIAYLKANTHPETNMWVITKDKRQAIAGTNFDWTSENMAALTQRFVVEDRTAS